MDQNNKSLIDQLNDTKHKKKLNDVFLELLAKQKAKANPFGVVRSETLPTKEIKPGADTYD